MRPLVLLIMLCPLPVLAQDGPRGIAFVQAPEQGSGVAMGATPDAAFALAEAQCVASGARAEDCLRTTWCFPAGWTVDIFAQHREGPHWHEVTCGLPSRAVAEVVAHALCDPAERPYLIECLPVQIYDPEGTPLLPD